MQKKQQFYKFYETKHQIVRKRQIDRFSKVSKNGSNFLKRHKIAFSKNRTKQPISSCFRTCRKPTLLYISNQSRMCGKGVGLGLFPSDSLESQSYDFDEIAHIRPLYWCRDKVRLITVCFLVFFGFVSQIPVIRF